MIDALIPHRNFVQILEKEKSLQLLQSKSPVNTDTTHSKRQNGGPTYYLPRPHIVPKCNKKEVFHFRLLHSPVSTSDPLSRSRVDHSLFTMEKSIEPYNRDR